jgi:phosphoribosyl 1,2-cyclic phosphodiesterase
MTLRFQSLCSSSAGNCLVLWSDTTGVIIDCGLSSMRKARALLQNLPDPRAVGAVIVSHMHGDHINRQSLRVIAEYGLPVKVHEQCLDQLRDRHIEGHRGHLPDLKTFSDNNFTIGDLTIQPFEVPHHPSYPNFGFAVRCRERHAWKHAVIVTDFHNGGSALEYFVDADFIFVESNHDPGLLAQYFNPNSRYHMSNPKTAELICASYSQSKRKPHTVMLGHLSEQRNTEHFALEEMRGAFRERGVRVDFNLFAAPLREVSRVVEI